MRLAALSGPAGIAAEPARNFTAALTGSVAGAVSNVGTVNLLVGAPIENAHPHSAIRKGDFKLLYYWDTRTTELFNLALNQAETRNLASANAAQADALRAELQAHLRAGLGDTAYATLQALGSP